MKRNVFENVMNEQGFDKAMFLCNVQEGVPNDYSIISRKEMLEFTSENAKNGLCREVISDLQILLDNPNANWFLHGDGSIQKVIKSFEDIEEFLEDDPKEEMTWKEANEYWNNNFESDPCLLAYDSKEAWLKDSIENGYVIKSEEDEALEALEKVQKLIVDYRLKIDDLFDKENAKETWYLIEEGDALEYVKENNSIEDIFDDYDIMDYVRDNMDIEDYVSIDWK